tara:strand:+ start:1436 stop:1561 length:126 start_codon:yes stop_codon:yes gene_type:complete
MNKYFQKFMILKNNSNVNTIKLVKKGEFLRNTAGLQRFFNF